MTKAVISRYVLLVITVSVIVLASVAQLGQALADEYDQFVYLPIIQDGASRVPNGDFEAGPVIWTQYSEFSYPLIVSDDALPFPVSPHNGNWAARLGGDSAELAYIEQTFVIDPEFPYLSYWQWIDWPFSCQGATGASAVVSLNQTVVHQTDVCVDTDTGGWVKQVIDLGAFVGQYVTLRLQLTTEINSYANWFLDDINLQRVP